MSTQYFLTCLPIGINLFACATKYLGVEVAAGLRLGASKQSDSVIVLLATWAAAFSKVLPVLQRQ